MLEYFVFNLEYVEDNGYLISALNAMAKEGWRVVCNTTYGLILEREKRPVITETENRTTIIYEWGATLQEPNHETE